MELGYGGSAQGHCQILFLQGRKKKKKRKQLSSAQLENKGKL